MKCPAPSCTSTQIYLVRHGETVWNAEGRFQGVLDSQLTEVGIAQAKRCGALLATTVFQVDAIYASPLGRTRQTEAIIRNFGTYPDTSWEPRLMEVSTGSWDGLTGYEIDAGWPGLLNGSTPYDWYFRSPDGENFESAIERVGSWMHDLSGVVVAISHGLAGRLIRGAYLGLSREDTLSLPVPQDVIWRMINGRVEAICA